MTSKDTCPGCHHARDEHIIVRICNLVECDCASDGLDLEDTAEW